MFKLPVLKPHLTGTNGVEGWKAKGKRESKGSNHGNSSTVQGPQIDIKSWEEQAEEITTNANCENFRSNALYAEFKLKDALSKCRMGDTAEDPEKPHRLRTAVCCQMLGELSKMSGLYNGVMEMIREEMVKSIYSDYYLSGNGSLLFEQVPYFIVANRLANEKERMLEEKEMWKKDLLNRQEDVIRIEHQLVSLQEAFKRAEERNRDLDGKVHDAGIKERRAMLEAQLAKIELMKLRQEIVKLNQSLEESKEECNKLKEASKKARAAHQEDLNSLVSNLKESKESLSEAQAALVGKVPEAELDAAITKISTLEYDLTLAQQEILKLQHVTDRMGSMTPRPRWADMKSIQDNEISGASAEIASKLADILEDRSQQAEELSESLAQAKALLLPEAKAGVHKLSMVADSSEFFVTEAGELDGNEPIEHALPLGISCDVPRFLRSKDPIRLMRMDLDDVLTSLRSILRLWGSPGSRANEFSIRDCILPCMLEIHGGLKGAVSGGYSLLHNCNTHAQGNTQITLFLDAIEGRIPESAYIQIGGVLQAFTEVLGCLGKATDAFTDGCIPLSTITECIRNLFSSFGPSELQALVELLDTSFTSKTMLPSALAVNGAQFALWPMPPEEFSTIFEYIANVCFEKFKACVESISVGLSQKSTKDDQRGIDVIHLSDAQATIKSQSIVDPELMLAGMKRWVGVDNIRGDRMPVEPLKEYLRVRSNFEMAGLCDIKKGMEFCMKLGATDNAEGSFVALPEMA